MAVRGRDARVGAAGRPVFTYPIQGVQRLELDHGRAERAQQTTAVAGRHAAAGFKDGDALQRGAGLAPTHAGTISRTLMMELREFGTQSLTTAVRIACASCSRT